MKRCAEYFGIADHQRIKSHAPQRLLKAYQAVILDK